MTAYLASAHESQLCYVPAAASTRSLQPHCNMGACRSHSCLTKTIYSRPSHSESAFSRCARLSAVPAVSVGGQPAAVAPLEHQPAHARGGRVSLCLRRLSGAPSCSAQPRSPEPDTPCDPAHADLMKKLMLMLVSLTEQMLLLVVVMGVLKSMRCMQ